MSSNSATIKFPNANESSVSPNESGEEVGRYSYQSNDPHASIANKTDLHRDLNTKTSRSSTNAAPTVSSYAPPHERWRYVKGEDVTSNDVVLGRGIGKHHDGNVKFRGLVRKYKYKYLAAPKASKPRVAEEVVAEWREAGGRFLARKSGTNGSADIRAEIWYDVGDKKAREKASMSLRERTAEAESMLADIRKDKSRDNLIHHYDHKHHDEQENNGSVRAPLRSTTGRTNHPSFPAPMADSVHRPREFYQAPRYDGLSLMPPRVPEEPAALYAPQPNIPRPPPQNIRGPASVHDYYPHQHLQPWKDYSGGRSSSIAPVRLDRDLSPAGRPSSDHGSSSANSEPRARSEFEATLLSELQEMRKSMDKQTTKIEEQAKQIALLEEKLVRKEEEGKENKEAEEARKKRQENDVEKAFTAGQPQSKHNETPVTKNAGREKFFDSDVPSYAIPRPLNPHPGLETPQPSSQTADNFETSSSLDANTQWVSDCLIPTDQRRDDAFPRGGTTPLRPRDATAATAWSLSSPALAAPLAPRPHLFVDKATSPLRTLSEGATAPWSLSQKRSRPDDVVTLFTSLSQQKKQKTSSQEIDLEPPVSITSV